MGSGHGTVAEGAVDHGELDDGSGDPEMEDLNVRTQQVAARNEAASPAMRLREVGTRATGYEREYRLKLLHRLLMRGIPLDTIAAELKVSVDTVLRDRKKLYHHLRQQAAGMDANELIGETIGFYSETQAMALKAASSNKNPMNIRLAAIRTALSSRNDRHRFFQASGVFDVLQFKASDEAGSNDLDSLMELTSKMLEQDDIMDGLTEEHDVDIGDVLQGQLEEEMELELNLF